MGFRLGIPSERDFDAALAGCRKRLAQPGTSFTLYTVAQVRARALHRTSSQNR
jgi:hypothetical protein